MAKLGTVHCGLLDCHFPEMGFFETRGSLEFGFIPAPLGSPESTAEGVVTARVDGEEPLSDALPLGLMCSGSRQSWVVPLGVWMDGVGGSHPLLFTKERYCQFTIEFCCSL